MILYLPPLASEHIDSEPGATGFSPADGMGYTGLVDYLDCLDPADPVVPLLKQGYRVTPTDLNVIFLDGLKRFINPYSLSYSVGPLSGDQLDSFHPIGSVSRIPACVRTGRFFPNFQVGDQWFTGAYLILWKYKINKESEEETKETLFRVVTAGVYASKLRSGNYHDVPATVVVLGA